MLRDEYNLLIEEKEKKPNRYMAKALLVCVVLTMSGLVLNELGVYRIDKSLMRVLSTVTCIVCLIPSFIVKNEKWISNPGCKYILMGIFFIPTFMAVSALNFHATLLLVFPLLMVTQYRSKKLFWVTLGTTVICTIIATLFSYKTGMWDPTFVEMVYSFSSKLDIMQTVPTVIPEGEIVQAIGIYLIMPKVFIICVLGVIIRGLVKNGIEDIENRVHIIHLNETDVLTDVMNRNMYEMRTGEYKDICKETVVCMFADANGLHEINNEKGHAAGDALLKCVADEIKKQFHREDVYRIGGDEFVAFATDLSLDELQKRTSHIIRAVEDNHYYVSIGIAEMKKTGKMDMLIREAEQSMYQEKKRYYETVGKERRRRRTD